MRDRAPYKVTTEAKKHIIASAIEGKTIGETVKSLLENYKVDVSNQTVWKIRVANAKRIAAALDDQLNRAMAVSPLASLENRMLTLERVVEEGFDDYNDAVKQLNSDDDLNPEQEGFLRMKGIRSLQAVNDAVKIADAAMNRMLAMQMKMREYNAKNNLDSRNIVEETILTVQKRVFKADEKRQERKANINDLIEDVEWIEADDLED